MTPVAGSVCHMTDARIRIDWRVLSVALMVLVGYHATANISLAVRFPSSPLTVTEWPTAGNFVSCAEKLVGLYLVTAVPAPRDLSSL